MSKETLETIAIVCFIILSIALVLKTLPYRIRSIFRRRRPQFDDSTYERLEALELRFIEQDEINKKTKSKLKKLKKQK